MYFRLLQISVKNSFVERFLRRFSQKAPEVEGEQPSARPAGRETPSHAGRRPGPRPSFSRGAAPNPARNLFEKMFRDLQKLSPRMDKRVGGQTQSYAKAFEQFGLNFRLLQISVISLSGESFGRAFSKARGFQRQSLWSRSSEREPL